MTRKQQRKRLRRDRQRRLRPKQPGRAPRRKLLLSRLRAAGTPYVSVRLRCVKRAGTPGIALGQLFDLRRDRLQTAHERETLTSTRKQKTKMRSAFRHLLERNPSFPAQIGRAH